jgi:hypothetical protein
VNLLANNDDKSTQTSFRKFKRPDFSAYGPQLKNMKTFNAIIKRNRRVTKAKNSMNLKEFSHQNTQKASQFRKFQDQPTITIESIDENKQVRSRKYQNTLGVGVDAVDSIFIIDKLLDSKMESEDISEGEGSKHQKLHCIEEQIEEDRMTASLIKDFNDIFSEQIHNSNDSSKDKSKSGFLQRDNSESSYSVSSKSDSQSKRLMRGNLNESTG